MITNCLKNFYRVKIEAKRSTKGIYMIFIGLFRFTKDRHLDAKGVLKQLIGKVAA
jgi:hypothetical protein